MTRPLRETHQLLAPVAFREIDAEGTDLLAFPRPNVFADALAAQSLLPGRFDAVVTLHDAQAVAEAACAALRVNGAGLAADIAMLAHRFLAEFHLLQAQLRLDIATSTSCPRLHIDSVHVRLITTYVGPGTEYAHSGEPDAVQQIPTGAVALLKGSRHPTHAGTVRHRSPETTTAMPRVVLAIDF